MRFAIATALFFSGLALSAEFVQPNTTEVNMLLTELAKLPTCATTCVTQSLTQTTCDVTDFACSCRDTDYESSSERCILSNCTVRGALASQAWQKKACQAPVRDGAPLNRQMGEALLIIATLVIILRFSARRYFQNTYVGWDDWMILLAWVGIIPSTALVQVMTHHGMGKDIWNIDPNGITDMLKLFYIEQYIYQLVIVATKISIVLFYLRIFPSNTFRRFEYISWAIITGLLTYMVGFWIYYAADCRPLSYFWNQWDGEHEGSCPGTEIAVYINSALNIFFDLAVFFLPVPQIMPPDSGY